MRGPAIHAVRRDATVPATDGADRARFVMRVGLGIAAVLLVLGTLIELVTGAPADAVRVPQLLSDPRVGDRVLMLGVIVLAFTPVIQVLVLLAAWLRVRDYRYSAVAAGVIALLAAGVMLGIAG